MYGVDASKKTFKLKKAYNVNASKKTEKLKKCYVVDDDKKLVKLWSAFTPRFIGANVHNIFKSVDGVTWETVDVPWDTSYKKYWSGAEECIGMTFGLGKYWIANGKYLCSSEDGDTWTIEKTTENISGYVQTGFLKVFYVNGQICTFDGYTQTLYVTTDGKNWSTISTSFSMSNNNYYNNLELVYGTIGTETAYIWLFKNEGSSYLPGYKLYKSTTLDGDKTLINASYTDHNNGDAQIAISGGMLFLSDGYSSSDDDEPCRLYYLKNLSGGKWSLTSDTYGFFLGSSGSGLLALTVGYTGYYYDTQGDSPQLKDLTWRVSTNAIYRNLHPPYSPEGTVAFPFNVNGTNCAFYKKKDETAFTKVTSGVGTCVKSLDPYAAAYGVDGGGFYTT